MYQVLEFAGMNNESEAREYLSEMYSRDEIEEMPVDITFNGSTEY